MAPALTHEMACSELRPPNTIATRVFRGVVTFSGLSLAGMADVTLLCVSQKWDYSAVCQAKGTVST